MKNTRSPSLLSCPPSSFPWLHPHPASSATFSRGHTHTHRDTHCHAQMHTFKHQTCSSYKAGLYSLGRVYALYVFAPVCVYIGVCMCAWTLVFPLSSGLPTTNIAPSLFPSFSLPLFCCTNPPPPHPSHYGPWKTSTTFPPDPNAHLTKMLHPHMWL